MEVLSVSEAAFDIVENTHRNVFLTGEAGTGKTTFLKRVLNETEKNCVVVAPTGVASINAGGSTIH
ncbi:MAG: AAA family ATPase, partial [Bacteroidia bacterium]|nr:AAA family ATPase [Bacteroidia bacterium]